MRSSENFFFSILGPSGYLDKIWPRMLPNKATWQSKHRVSPYPLNLGDDHAPPKFRGRPSKNTIKQGASDTPPLLNLGGESARPEFRGYGVTGQGKLSGVIRANRFARFVRIGRFARIGNSSDSCESAWCAIKIGVSITRIALRIARATKKANLTVLQPFYCSFFVLYVRVGVSKWFPS